jgi:hypothetical protein
LKIFIYTAEDMMQGAGTFVYAPMVKDGMPTDGFGCDNYQEFLAEISRLNLKFPND